ncbi:YhjD/YihY/BrkB family envelope integrity protein [Planosporangium sp. 12N6]|uniref:YhjD/YihY/BrkB family envelope integrity protein n=1 Tax=Planosporangium spinosum TaxID=3402278 RepID=UPI003CEB9E38
MGTLRAVPRRLIGRVVGALRGRDLALHAAATTFYGGIAVVPVSLLTLRLAAAIVGTDRLAARAGRVAAAFPAELGANLAATRLVTAGLHLSAAQAVAALLPATLYGEGLRRSLVSLAGGAAARRERAIGWRGRLLVLPLLAAGPGLLLALLLALPWAAGLLGRGGLASVAAVVVSFLGVWLALSPVVIWVYRFVGPARPPWPAATAGGSFAAANLSGFLHGFVLFWSLPLNLGLPFGGFAAVGAVVAVALWLYVLHVVVLVGYVFTRQLGRLVAPHPSPGSGSAPPGDP